MHNTRFKLSSAKTRFAVAAASALMITAPGVAQAAVSASNSSPLGAVALTPGMVTTTGSSLVFGSLTVVDTVGTNAGAGDTTFSLGSDYYYFGGTWDLTVNSAWGTTIGDSGSLLVTFKNGLNTVGSACINGGSNAYVTCGDYAGATAFTLPNGAKHEVGNLYFQSTSAFDTVVVSYGGGHETYSLSGAVAAVPEPETYAMMLAGLGAMGFLARRRRAQ